MIDIYRLFAKTKPYVSLCDHCEEVGKVAGILWDIGIVDKYIISRKVLCFLASLHDIGKCYPDFQKCGLGLLTYIDNLMAEGYLPTANNPYRHEIGTAAILKRRHHKAFKDSNTARASEKILRLHHQKSSMEYLNPSPKEKEWCEAQDAVIAEMERRFNMRLKEIEFSISDAVCVRIWGVIVLADWLASGGIREEFVERIFCSKPLGNADFGKLFSLKNLRPLQEMSKIIADSFCDKIPSCVIIEAPMGEGKTEAALYLATQISYYTGKSGFYIALPTMATARQMENRASEMLKRQGFSSAVLVHSEAWLEQETDWGEEVDQSWFAPTKRALLSRYAVGTVDQAMMSVIKIKQGVLRLLGLSSKVLVIDEMHAYDTYMQTILYRLMEWCAAISIPVIILSATLPRDRRGKILEAFGGKYESLSGAYPLITSAYRDGSIAETSVAGTYIARKIQLERAVYVDSKNVADRALKAVEGGGCAAVIMNTVKDAQDVYAECKALMPSDVTLMLFHARFLAKDRRQIEEACVNLFGKNSTNRPYKAVLIATQVVEQSLDVDFDVMISALAPIDLLLQRSGRLHRHERIRPSTLAKPRFIVLVNGDQTDLPGIGRIYYPWLLSKTEEILSDKKEICIPEEIRCLIEAVYDAKPELSDARINLWMEAKSNDNIKEGAAKDVRYPEPSPDWFFAIENDYFFEESDDNLTDSNAMTRLSGKNIKIAVLPESIYDEKRLAAPDIAYAKQVSDFCVSIRAELGIPSDGVFPCKGYLKGIWAVRSEGEFHITFGNNRLSRVKKYSVSSEYGLKEDK